MFLLIIPFFVFLSSLSFPSSLLCSSSPSLPLPVWCVQTFTLGISAMWEEECYTAVSHPFSPSFIEESFLWWPLGVKWEPIGTPKLTPVAVKATLSNNGVSVCVCVVCGGDIRVIKLGLIKMDILVISCCCCCCCCCCCFSHFTPYLFTVQNPDPIEGISISKNVGFRRIKLMQVKDHHCSVVPTQSCVVQNELNGYH